LAIAQKNGVDLNSTVKTTVGFDFAIAEECQAFEECDVYTAIYGDELLEIEYTDEDNADEVFNTACEARGSNISIILRDRFVVPKGDDDYSYSEC
jgi:hypothetical protein